MRAYARIKTRDEFRPLHLARGPVYTMEEALERMRGLIPARGRLDAAGGLAARRLGRRSGKRRRSATAASFAAALELVKAGRLDLRQEAPFQPDLPARARRPAR